jgi:hypothetical protein
MFVFGTGIEPDGRNMKVIIHVAFKKVKTTFIIISVLLAFVHLWLGVFPDAAPEIRIQGQVVTSGADLRSHSQREEVRGGGDDSG